MVEGVRVAVDQSLLALQAELELTPWLIVISASNSPRIVFERRSGKIVLAEPTS